jgi:hypothetical protein
MGSGQRQSADAWVENRSLLSTPSDRDPTFKNNGHGHFIF